MKIPLPAFALMLLVLSRADAADQAQSPDLIYRVPLMDQVTVRSNLIYKTAGNLALTADIYLPRGTPSNAALPVIIFVLGDASPEQLREAKDWRFFQSYGRLAGASGFAGVTFNHRSSENFKKLADVRSDIDDLLHYVRLHASELCIDKDQICFWFFSGSGPHLSVTMGANKDFVRCVVAYYPLLAAPNSGAGSGVAAADFSSIEQLTRNAPRVPPLLLVKAGRDGVVLNRLIDDFRNAAKAAHVPLDYLEHPQGRHAFDILNDDETSRGILRQTIEFIQKHVRGR